MSTKLVALHTPSSTGVENIEVREVCEMILDDWRLFTPLQVAIASTIIQYAKPAESVSTKQLYHLNQARAAYQLRQEEPSE